MNYSVINWGDMLHIVDEEAQPVYHLDNETLQKLSRIDDVHCSACVFHLASYGLLPTSALYQVASYIQKQFPHLQIDWFTTFYYVERVNYVNTAFCMKEMLEEGDRGYGDNRLSRFIEFEENDTVEGADAILLKIVMMNIINFDVKVR